MKNSIFEFEDYRRFLRVYIRSLPKRGHGEIARLAQHLNLYPAHMSQILAGDKTLTLEHGHELASYLGLSSLETDFLVLLIEKDRAGSHNLKKYFESKLSLLRQESTKLAKRIATDSALDDTAKAVFYSSSVYSAIRLLTSIEEFQEVDRIAARMQMTRAQTTKVLRFLVEKNLCVEANGRFSMGPQRTHLEQGSPFVSRHHTNWRVKSLSVMESLREDELMFTAPLTIGRSDFAALREKIILLIKELSERVKDSKAESLFCLNIDLFEVR